MVRASYPSFSDTLTVPSSRMLAGYRQTLNCASQTTNGRRNCHSYSGQPSRQGQSIQAECNYERACARRTVFVFCYCLPNTILNSAYSQGGHEKQYRFHCSRCTLPVAYQSTPPPVKSGPYLYILKGALSQIQGQIPSDAFEDENVS